MQEIWQRLKAELTRYSPDLVTRLRPGSDEAAIAQAEQRLGITFTEEVKEFFQLQNGSGGPFFGSWEVLSLDELCQDWLSLKAQPLDLSAYLWDKTWVPLLHTSPYPDLRLYIRIDPKEEDGENIQEEEMPFFDSPQFPRARLGTLFLSGLQAQFVAASIEEFLEDLLKALEKGYYIYDARANKLCTVNFGSPLPVENEPEFYDLIDKRLAYVEEDDNLHHNF